MTVSPMMSEACTEGIRVQAIAEYIPKHSTPEENNFLYSYNITITNEGEQQAKLISRHWIIINSMGEITEVKAPGIMGDNCPTLAPGDSFEYTGFCPLDTNFGTMEGTYQIERENGDVFEAEIGRFYLATTAPTSYS